MAESLKQEANLVIPLSAVQTVVLVSIMHMCAAPAFLQALHSQLFGSFLLLVVFFFSSDFHKLKKKTCAFWYSHQSAALPQRLVYIWGISVMCAHPAWRVRPSLV